MKDFKQFDVVQLKRDLNENMLSGIKCLVVEVFESSHGSLYDVYVYRPTKKEFYMVEGCQKIHHQFLEKIDVEDKDFLNARLQFMLSWSRKRRKEQDNDSKSEITFLRLENKYGLSRNTLESIWKDMCKFKKDNQ
jgi:hypothetical protein